MSQGQGQKILITSSIVLIDIPIKPQQFSTSSLSCMQPLFRCHDLDLAPMTLKLNHNSDIPKMHLHVENEVPRPSHCKASV